LSDAELREVAALAIEELRHRAKRRIEEIVARIKALAAEGELVVTIEGHSGKPGTRTRAVKQTRPGNRQDGRGSVL
jgi:RNase P protein component